MVSALTRLRALREDCEGAGGCERRWATEELARRVALVGYAVAGVREGRPLLTAAELSAAHEAWVALVGAVMAAADRCGVASGQPAGYALPDGRPVL
jgi:hypothetical protein